MRQAGRSKRYVFLLWTVIALVSGAAALAGYTLLGGAPPEVLATITALAAGAILAMIENYRSGMIWGTMRKNRYVQAGLTRAGFNGGWLTASAR